MRRAVLAVALAAALAVAVGTMLVITLFSQIGGSGGAVAAMAAETQCPTPAIGTEATQVVGAARAGTYTGPERATFTRDQYWSDVLTTFGITPTVDARVFGVAWMRNESGTKPQNPQRYNLLNTSRDMSATDPGQTTFNSHGVKGYTRYSVGINATVETLNLGYYRGIVAALRAGGDATTFVAALKASPWDAAHYAAVDFGPLLVSARTEVTGKAPAPQQAGAPVTAAACAQTDAQSAGPVDVTAGQPGADTSALTCPAYATDGGIHQTARGNSIRTCTVDGITVNASIATNIHAMVQAAARDGITLGGGGFRSYADQLAAGKANGCAGWPNWTSSSQCSPPTAPPGTSQHEQGLAIDFRMTGGVFGWLTAHANTYGMVNFPVERWHWSTTGR